MCHACSSHESEDGNARAGAGIRRLHSAKSKGAAGLGYELGAQLPATAPLASKGSNSLTEQWVVRRPLRLLWRPFWLRFTDVTSVLVKKC
eukprot:COSAG01_NODE_2027_length_8600_cov_3.986356_7_plen_90_part_00